MKRSLVVVVVFLVGVLGPAALLLCDGGGRLPLALRDRALVAGLFALSVTVGAVVMARPMRRPLRWRLMMLGAMVIALGSTSVLAWRAHQPYVLPPASPSAGLGEPLPDLTLQDSSGAPVALSTFRGRPTLLVWFRGSWCPYCRNQLAKLARELPDYALAVRVVAVTSDPPEKLRALRQDLGLPFTVLSDPDELLMRRCELMHCVAIADGNGVVQWGVVSGNWRRDLTERALLQAAYAQR